MTDHAELLVETITSGPFVENCYIVADARSRRGILIDPGDEDSAVAARVRALDLTIDEIVATHAHIDHVAAVAPLKRVLGATFALHAAERPVLDGLPVVARMFGLPPPEVPAIDRELQDGDVVAIGELRAQVLATPGHSPGGCCLYLADQQVVFVGDTLFAGSIGRTDLPGGDLGTLLDAIRRRLLTLDDDVVVHSGHGPATTIGVERHSNPFLQPGFRG